MINQYGEVILIGLLSVIVLILIITTKGSRKVFKRSTLFYVICSIIVFALIGLSGYLLKTNEIPYMSLFYTLEATILVLGILHLWILYGVLPWSNRKSFLSEFLFTSWVLILGSLVFIGLYWFIGVPNYTKIYLYTFCVFPIPFFILKSYDHWMLIPGKHYIPYFLPPGFSFNMPLPPKNQDFILLTFFVTYSADKNNEQGFYHTVEVPLHYTTEMFFQVVLSLQKKESNQTIELVQNHKRDNPYGWFFIIFRNKKPLKYYLDPHAQVIETPLTGGDIILAKRVIA